jgi:uncharacterized cupin superfamily protein
MRGEWTDLGTAAGTEGAGVVRARIDPGGQTSPVHRHGAEEEIFFVLAGAGLSWQDGTVYDVAADDCIVYRASEMAHTLVAGPEGIDVLTFGPRIMEEATHLPRAGVLRIQETWADAGGGEHPWEREAAAGPAPCGEPAARPPNIVALPKVELETWGSPGGGVFSEWHDFGEAAGSRTTGMCHVRVPPGKLGCPPHCHSSEEEIFVVLDGSGELLLDDARHPVRAGHVVARPPATRVAHAFEAGPGGLTYLAWGTRERNDIAFYPRSGKVNLRGVGVIGRIERLDYWDGEP